MANRYNKIKQEISWRKLLLLLFWPFSFFLSWISTFSPLTVEMYYSRYFSTQLTQVLSRITGVIPISLAEILLLLFIVGLVTGLILTILKVLLRSRSRSEKTVGRYGILTFILNVGIFLGIIYFCFMVVWGLNYNRLPFAQIADLQVESVAESELVQLCEKLIDRANSLRTNLQEDDHGVMMLGGGFKKVQDEAVSAYAKAIEIYPELGGSYGRPKPVFFSQKMSYTGISGVYFPFTGEANVNVDMPDLILPATTCHEMAHQRGFAREDEANYIAWVTCSTSEDPEFQYSGTLHALIYAINALYENHPDQVGRLTALYGEGLKRDLKALSDYWERFEGSVEEVTSDVNDAYLKSNRQEEGIKSYGRMVDLLIAEQKADAKKKFIE